MSGKRLDKMDTNNLVCLYNTLYLIMVY